MNWWLARTVQHELYLDIFFKGYVKFTNTQYIQFDIFFCLKKSFFRGSVNNSGMWNFLCIEDRMKYKKNKHVNTNSLVSLDLSIYNLVLAKKYFLISKYIQTKRIYVTFRMMMPLDSEEIGVIMTSYELNHI